MAHDLATQPASIHPTAIVEEGAVLGADVRVWHRSHVRTGSRIGAGSSLGFCVFVDAGVEIGERCKIQNHVSVYRGVTLEDDVFVGPHATFTNDRYPRADAEGWEVVPTIVRAGASIGANATIVCGVELGRRCVVGAGSVVTKDVPAYALVLGAPARIHAWVCRCGRPIARLGDPVPTRCPHCGRPWTSEVRS
jgi:UDP-2-acetamido-3-amino-2,3-dideoxy-glucuronate N-acetyltransferase